MLAAAVLYGSEKLNKLLQLIQALSWLLLAVVIPPLVWRDSNPDSLAVSCISSH